MSKRTRKDESHGDREHRSGRERYRSLRRCSARSSEFAMPKVPRTPATAMQQQQQQHLYVVVDDWERGYSVYRFDDDDFVPDPNACGIGKDARPVVRMEAQHPHSWSFAAHGSKILAMLPPEYSPGIPVFDTETMGMAVWPSPLCRGDSGSKSIYISAGGRFLAFAYPFVEVIGPELPGATDESWSWTSIEPPPPFASSVVSGYAVHPDGRTVFVSVDDWRPDIPGKIAYSSYPHLESRKSTFTFDMERHEWTHVGEWLLPFKGQAHYDCELDAWVGLCLYSEGAGCVCSCDVPVPPSPSPSPSDEGTGERETTTVPHWKLGRDVLFDATDTNRYSSGASLVYMGDSRFCMVERRAPPGSDAYASKRVVKMTRFFLKYDKEGELRASTNSYYASFSYELAHERIDRLQNPVAFCI